MARILPDQPAHTHAGAAGTGNRASSIRLADGAGIVSGQSSGLVEAGSHTDGCGSRGLQDGAVVDPYQSPGGTAGGDTPSRARSADRTVIDTRERAGLPLARCGHTGIDQGDILDRTPNIHLPEESNIGLLPVRHQVRDGMPLAVERARKGRAVGDWCEPVAGRAGIGLHIPQPGRTPGERAGEVQISA